MFDPHHSLTRGETLTGTVAHQFGRIRYDKVGGRLNCSDHALMECTNLREMGQVKSRVSALNFRRPNFQVFKELMNRTPWETTFRNTGHEQSLQRFKDIFLRAQEFLISMYKKLVKEGKRSAWVS